METILREQNIEGNRKYKDSLFRMVFEKKEDLLELYNAINGTHYKNVDELEVNTLENALYMGIKNDISFLIGYTMNLYEHQSSKNANMPIRGLIYLSRQFENYIEEHNLKIYSSKLQKLPTPQFVVFYNGMTNEPDEKIMRLSDAFVKDGGCLECEVRLLNINYGRNRELMERCKRLGEYALFIAKVREYQNEEKTTLATAITKAIDECLEKGILRDILTKQRNEVFAMILSAFDKELYEKDLKDEAFEEGLNQGINQVIRELVAKKIAKGKNAEQIADELEESVDVIETIMKEL